MDRIAALVAQAIERLRTGRGLLPSGKIGEVAARGGVLAATSALLGLTVVLSTALLAGPLLGAAVQSVDITTSDTALDRLGERSVVRAADGSMLAALHDEIDRDVVDLEAVPGHVRQAVVTAEDRRFFEHNGYDLEGIGRAALANFRARDLQQGGSTITQQLAKQNFVGSEKTLGRKVSELFHAMGLESRFSKRELLERYLNQVYFGRGAYGIAAAADNYFGKDVGDLTVGEASLLAALIRSPSSLDPQSAPERAEERRNQVLQGMVDEGYLSASAAAEARAAGLEVSESGDDSESSAPHVVEAVKREFLEDPAFGDTRDERIATLFSGGLEIHTTVDPRLQELASEVIDERYEGQSGPTGAIAAVDPRNGRVRALESGREFAQSQFNLATQGRRQPGSAFKPFVLATALEEGFPPDLRLEGNSPSYFEGVRGWDRDGDGVRNYRGASFGRVGLRTATVNSVNTAYAELATTLGIEPVADLLERVGFAVDKALGEADQRSPGIALGGVRHGVTPLEMASAYSAFAAAGERAEPFLIERITGPDGETLYERTSEPTTAIEPAVAAHVTDILQDVVRRGTGTAAQLPDWEPAGKTGTTQQNRDAWFTGYVPVLSTAVWVGHPDRQETIPGLTGGSAPAELWREFMVEALASVEPTDFPDVDADLEELHSASEVDVPDVTDQTLEDARAALLQERLITRVRRIYSQAPEDEVVWQSPSPGESVSLGESVVLGVSRGFAEDDPSFGGSTSSGSSEPEVTPSDEADDAGGDTSDEDSQESGSDEEGSASDSGPGNDGEAQSGVGQPSTDGSDGAETPEGSDDPGSPQGNDPVEPQPPLEDGGPADSGSAAEDGSVTQQ